MWKLVTLELLEVSWITILIPEVQNAICFMMGKGHRARISYTLLLGLTPTLI